MRGFEQWNISGSLLCQLGDPRIWRIPERQNVAPPKVRLSIFNISTIFYTSPHPEIHPSTLSLIQHHGATASPNCICPTIQPRSSQPVASSCIKLHFHQSFASLSSQGVLTEYIYCTKVLSQYWSDQFSCIDCLLRAWLYQGQSILTETASCVLHDAHTIAQNTIARCTLLHGILSTTYYCMA